LASFLLFIRKEDPIEELTSHLNVILKVALSLLVPCERVNVEDKLFAGSAEDFDELLTFLHPDDGAVVEDNFDSLVGVGCEGAQTLDRQLLYDDVAARHVLDVKLSFLDIIDETCCSESLGSCFYS
jgi:hypothetical protein